MDLVDLAAKVSALGLVPILLIGLSVLWVTMRADRTDYIQTIRKLTAQLATASTERHGEALKLIDRYHELVQALKTEVSVLARACAALGARPQ